MAIGAQLTAASDYLFQRLFKFLFRYDIFISYARRDGKDYAHKLRDQLTRLDFSCFLDFDELPAGNSLNKTLRRALRRSAVVILVGTEGALKSRYVELEVGEFARTNRAIIPIDFEGTLAAAPWPIVRERDLVWIDETKDALAKSTPSPQVADQIDKLFKYTRRNVRVRGQVIATASLFLLGAALSVFLIQRQVQAARDAGEAAQHQERIANDATEQARLEQGRATDASVSAAQATAGAANAQLLAALERVRAETQSEIADAKTLEARRAQEAARAAQREALAATQLADERARATRVGLSNLLSVRSRTLLDEQPRLSLLLAAEAMRATREDDPRVVAAEQTLRQTLTKAGGRVLGGEGWEGQVGDAPEGTEVEAIALSPNRRWMASASYNRLRLFDLNAPSASAPARIIEEAGAPLAFSADGRWLIAARKEPRRSAQPTPGGRPTEYALRLWDLNAPEAEPLTIGGYRSRITTVEASSDGRWLVIGSENGVVELWDLKSVRLVPRPIEVGGHTLVSLALSPDGRWLVTSGGSIGGGFIMGGGWLRLWDLSAADPTAKHFDLQGHQKSVTEMAFSPDGRWLATGSYGCDDGVRLWNLKKVEGAARPIVLKHAGSVGALAFSPDNHWLVTGSGFSESCVSDSTARVWNLKAADPAAKPAILPGHEGAIFAATFSPDSRILVTAVGSGYSIGRAGVVTSNWGMRSLYNQQGSATAHVWYWGNYAALLAAGRLEEEGGALPAEVVPHLIMRDPLNSADAFAVSPDRRWLVARSRNNLVVWDTLANPQSFAAGGNPAVLRGHDGHISAASFSPDSRWLVTGSRDRSARLWDLAAGTNTATPVNNRAEADEVPFASAAFEVYAVMSKDRRLLFAAGDAPAPATENEQNPEEASGRFASVGYVWSLDRPAAGRPLVLRGHGGRIKDAALSPDGRWLATGSVDKTARLWDLRAADPSARPLVFAGHAGAVDDVALSPDGRWLVTASHDGAARLWNLNAPDPTARPALLRNIEVPVGEWQQYTNRVHLSPDGRWLVTAGSYYFSAPARLWDLKAADPATQPVELGKIVPEECAFSQNGRWLLVHRTYGNYGFNSEALLWDLERGARGTPFVLQGDSTKPIKPISSAAFSPDGRWLFTSNREQVVLRWDLTAPDPSAAHVTFGPLEEAGQNFGALIVSPDGRWLAAWADGSELRHRHPLLWQLDAKGMPAAPRVLENPGGYFLTEFAFSPDSKWLFGSYPAAGGEGGVLRWSVDAADPASVRLPGGGMLAGETVSADGRWLVTRQGSALELWPLRTADLLDLACRAAGRNLTQEEWKEYFPGQEYRATCPGLPEGK